MGPECLSESRAAEFGGTRGRVAENNRSLAQELSGKLDMWPRSPLVHVF